MERHFHLMQGPTSVLTLSVSHELLLPMPGDGMIYVETPDDPTKFRVVFDGSEYSVEPAEPSLTQQLDILRKRRDELLVATDRTDWGKDFTEEQRVEWAAYREQLRNWPENPESPEPTAPDLELLEKMLSFWRRVKQ